MLRKIGVDINWSPEDSGSTGESEEQNEGTNTATETEEEETITEDESGDNETDEGGSEEPADSDEESHEEGKQQTFVFNPKFKARDKDGNQIEYEVPEYLRGSVTTTEQEAQVREIFEKANGLDFVKPRFHEIRDKYQKLEQEHKQILGGLGTLKEYVQQGDFDSFFSALKIPAENVSQWLIDKVNYEQLPPEEKQLRETQKQADSRARQAEQQLANLQQQFQQQQVQARANEFSREFSKSEIQEFEKQFDTHIGRPGAFKDEVLNRAEIAWFTRNEMISAEQAIGDVKKIFGGSLNTKQGPKVITGQNMQIIPKIKGTSFSPTAPQIKSMQDLLKLRQQKYGD